MYLYFLMLLFRTVIERIFSLDSRQIKLTTKNQISASLMHFAYTRFIHRSLNISTPKWNYKKCNFCKAKFVQYNKEYRIFSTFLVWIDYEDIFLT